MIDVHALGMLRSVGGEGRGGKDFATLCQDKESLMLKCQEEGLLRVDFGVLENINSKKKLKTEEERKKKEEEKKIIIKKKENKKLNNISI